MNKSVHLWQKSPWANGTTFIGENLYSQTSHYVRAQYWQKHSAELCPHFVRGNSECSLMNEGALLCYSDDIGVISINRLWGRRESAKHAEEEPRLSKRRSSIKRRTFDWDVNSDGIKNARKSNSGIRMNLKNLKWQKSNETRRWKYFWGWLATCS